ncbi:MAG: 1-deoxy-D-xylulose-5-phosphate reductoisomerase [Pseudochelatococcus sp.]|jgi:1-deoxy-D-xylulose-5-phosphate reductoisomerase|uniref:1-deoxy-D-xylulose-5-phosphate reductoisomerase n=1 Tax=Pseudochelatococcus sp. TaxID=2020869 RepID=UPI003D9377DE
MTTRIVLLGATGSVGSAVVDVILRHPDRFHVEAIVSAGSDVCALASVARRTGARFVAVANPQKAETLARALADAGADAASGAGEAAIDEAVDRDADLVVAAIAGTAGLRVTHRAIRPGRRIALANKETLVSAGDAFMRDARAAGVGILPLDSEHNALWQAMGDACSEDIEELVLTASGGPFRKWAAEAIAAATPEEALRHPNYSMGAKISIDSASMMNKGLELIEAHHLFGVDGARLRVLVHPQQAVHGLVGFRDGSVVAGLAAPDMRIPAAHCLGLPGRLNTTLPRLDLAAFGRLDFEPPDLARFPALGLAFEALAEGGGMPTVLNAANEVAVGAFLSRRIGFGRIAALVRDACEAFAGRVSHAPDSVPEALALDEEARAWTHAQVTRGMAVA